MTETLQMDNSEPTIYSLWSENDHKEPLKDNNEPKLIPIEYGILSCNIKCPDLMRIGEGHWQCKRHRIMLRRTKFSHLPVATKECVIYNQT